MKVRTEPSLSLKAPVAVLGCGLVGSSWAALFLHYGINVQAWDPDQSARDSLNERIKNPMFQLASMAQNPKALEFLACILTCLTLLEVFFLRKKMCQKSLKLRMMFLLTSSAMRLQRH